MDFALSPENLHSQEINQENNQMHVGVRKRSTIYDAGGDFTSLKQPHASRTKYFYSDHISNQDSFRTITF